MNQIVQQLPYILGMAVVVLVLFSLFRTYLMSKIKVNKWVIVIVAVVVLFIPFLFVLPTNLYFVTYIFQGIFIFLFLWYFEVTGLFRRKTTSNPKLDKKGNYKSDIKYDKKKDIVIRPKAKPNRVKNLKK